MIVGECLKIHNYGDILSTTDSNTNTKIMIILLLKYILTQNTILQCTEKTFNWGNIPTLLPYLRHCSQNTNHIIRLCLCKLLCFQAIKKTCKNAKGSKPFYIYERKLNLITVLCWCSFKSKYQVRQSCSKPKYILVVLDFYLFFYLFSLFLMQLDLIDVRIVIIILN